jgi:hypothetical protein
MSARRRGRRHGGANDAAVASSATLTGNVVASGLVSEVVPGAIVEDVGVEATPGTSKAIVDDGPADGPKGADEAGLPMSSRNGFSRRAPRVVQTPAASSVLAAAPAAPAAPLQSAIDEFDLHKPACTLAQMRRFIKSRPYVPVHELRRRFLIEGSEDDVNAVPTEKGIVYVGLPVSEARFLADLIRAGEVGCELLLDPTSPAVVGVYAMRPVARQ